ncbi:uncharacterized protein LOC126970075 isoform X1 [Leptidea sinapis]|uniref:uncharacterized protein LOC126970075 isoform X1 n=2 Tax=Leptidea sinapis TaxID=189913 RepID=UPI0021265CC6|nr:uncharacterized protein LOC126970075 isoform X1 [Leptidea sinapis]
MLQPRVLISAMGSRNCVKWGAILVLFCATLTRCQELNENEQIEATRIKRDGVPENRAFNTNAIVYDNTPWRPGRDTDLSQRPADDDERKLRNLATRIMNNGVEVLVRDKSSRGREEETKYMEFKTIQPTASQTAYFSNLPKVEKRIDHNIHDGNGFDLIQPSEVSHFPCVSSCSCSNTKTDELKSKHTNKVQTNEQIIKTTKQDVSISDFKTTEKESLQLKTQYHPYDYETSSKTPTDKIVEKYTEVVNDYPDDKNSLDLNDLLTNEQAPTRIKNNKLVNNKTSEKIKQEKPQKVNKNKLVVAELIKLGSLGIKGLSQLAPVFEKMTGSFMKRQEINNTTTTTSKPATKVIPYNAHKRVDSDIESKHDNFPIYIPVDEMETSESQTPFSNISISQNFPWAFDYKYKKANLMPSSMVHESPLVNGGIPISPGEIIRANSDVIVGKPAVGGPLTLAASGIKLHNPIHPPLDSFMADSEQYIVSEKEPPFKKSSASDDDSYDLRPPEPPKTKQIPHRAPNRYSGSSVSFGHPQHNTRPVESGQENKMKNKAVIYDRSKPVFLDYVPSISSVSSKQEIPLKHQADVSTGLYNKKDDVTIDTSDSSPSSSEVVNIKIDSANIQFSDSEDPIGSPLLVNIQPSSVANVLIPHGSSTALIFAGSSEPHKTGDYVDDPLPYSEPGYFGSFSIDAPQMTNVHSVSPNKGQLLNVPGPNSPKDKPTHYNKNINYDSNSKWSEHKISKPSYIPPPTSNQETHVRVGPDITVYNPDQFKGDFEKYKDSKKYPKSKDSKNIIDKEYENYLAVPPPPPKQQYNQDNYHNKVKQYNQRPIVQTKPVKDLNVFLSVQHPVPQQSPPRVTSEIYFASQMPNHPPTPVYNIHVPANVNPMKPLNKNSFSVLTSQNTGINNSLAINEHNNELYAVTVNTATGMKNNANSGHIMGTSISVPISTSEQNGQLNANIPIGTNFAIRVEDDPKKYETVAFHGKPDPNLIYNGNNDEIIQYGQTHRENEGKIDKYSTAVQDISSITNSHANFPMIREHSLHSTSNLNKQGENKLSSIQKSPEKSTLTTTNSHGWYASILNDGNLKNINNVETTTRKVIPVTFDLNKDNNLPHFSKKMSGVGIPPTDLVHMNNKFNIGQPFSKPKQSLSQVENIHLQNQANLYKFQENNRNNNTMGYNERYTTRKTPENKFVYENSDEVFDGDDSYEENERESEGEISSESMKIPIVASSSNNHNMSSNKNISKKPIDDQKLSSKDFNLDTQTEKPFGSSNKTTFHSNSMKPIFNRNPYMKPRPFTVSSSIPLDHQLQQPHWQINHMMENGTNASYEDSFELNTGEEVRKNVTDVTTHRLNISNIRFDNIDTIQNRSSFNNDSNNIITSVKHIKDKKPLILDIPQNSVSPPFTVATNVNKNKTLSETTDLAPPSLKTDYKKRPVQNNELIMGMSPPPLDFSGSRYQSKPAQPTRPAIPVRNPPPYRNIPPRTLPQRPVILKKPTIKDEVSTYRPTYDLANKVKRPQYNRDQPSSLLLPPPRELPTKILTSIDIVRPTLPASSISKVIFPTPISSGWLTSSGVDFSSKFNFDPISEQNYIITSAKPQLDLNLSDTLNENSYSDEDISYGQESDSSLEKTETDITTARNAVVVIKPGNSDINIEDTVTQNRVISMNNKNRTRKPYPIRNSDLKTSEYKTPQQTISHIIKPTRTLPRPEILYSTQHSSVYEKTQPLSTPLPTIESLDIIESSETLYEDDFIRPTEILNEYDVHTTSPDITAVIEKTITSTLTISKDQETLKTQSVHHAGNEVKISDEIIPTKTEFKTTVVTLTKTLSEPPKTISSIGYVNLTHTLTVTHTKTSLVSQSEGAVTQTLVLTNTHTSTVVDVVTEVYTQVQPTTIVETVTKHVPIPQVEATSVQEITSTKVSLDDISMSSEERDNFIITDTDPTENIQKIDVEEEKDNDTFFVVMNKSQNGGKPPPINAEIETNDFDDGITRNEQVNNNGVAQVLFGEILLAGTPYLETTNVGHPTGAGYGKECQPDCKASRNERCQRIDGVMKCVCRPGFARMFPDRPCKPTYTYSVSLALKSHGTKPLKFHPALGDNSTKEYHNLAIATHEGINRMVMQSDLRDVFHGVHITGFHPVQMMEKNGERYNGVINDFYVQLSDNAHEYRLKEVIEKYLRNNNYSLGGTEVHAAADLLNRLNVSDFDECISGHFHDCSEHARCFNLRGTYTCSCLEGFADLSVNTLYPGRICSSEAVGCGTCNYHGTCFNRESTIICECFKWYAGKTCQVNLKAVLITISVSGLLVLAVVTIYASRRCCKEQDPHTQTFVIGCMQGMPSLHQGNMPKQRADRRALIAERGEAGETCSVQNASLPYIPAKLQRPRASNSKKCVISDPPAHSPPPPPAPAVLIPRARLHPLHSDSRDNLARKKSLEACNEAKLISYLESGATNTTEEMRRKHSLESSYSANKDRHNKQGALISAGFKVSTTVRPEENAKEDRDDASSVNKTDIDGQSHFDTLRKTYSQDDNISEWTDAERRIGELTLSEARSVGGTLPASTGRAASSTRLTHQENTMAERDLGSTFLLPHVHLYKPDPASDISEFDSL